MQITDFAAVSHNSASHKKTTIPQAYSTGTDTADSGNHATQTAKPLQLPHLLNKPLQHADSLAMPDHHHLFTTEPHV